MHPRQAADRVTGAVFPALLPTRVDQIGAKDPRESLVQLFINGPQTLAVRFVRMRGMRPPVRLGDVARPRPAVAF